jgi:hypothetical protein
MSSDNIDVSVIILTWNSQDFFVECLRSAQTHLDGLAYETIVVDNGSRDGGPELLAREFPQVHVIRNSVNRGVAAARNQGLAAARGRYIWLLDVDTRVLGGSVASLIGWMDENPEVGLVGARLVYADGSLQRSYRKFPTIGSKILRRLPGRWLERWRLHEHYSPDPRNSLCEVDYVIGACQFIRRLALDRVGLLDESIFYGPEDADYCLRLWACGWKVVYYPLLTVLHHEQRITKRRIFSRITWRHLVALFYYFRKHSYWFSREGLYARIASFPRAALGSDL